MTPRVNYSGLVIAGLGFFLTRFTVTLAVYQDPVSFYVAGVVPLALGLGLAAFGVALTVADVDPTLVRTTARWTVIGTVTMLTLVVLTLVGASPGRMLDLETIRAQTYLSNSLIAGSIGGTFTGLYAARSQRQREQLQQHANRLDVLNRLLRHEVLNAVTVIRGYTETNDAVDADGRDVIEEYSTSIQQTIEDVNFLTKDPSSNGTIRETIDLDPCLENAIDRVQERHPDVSLSVTSEIDAPVVHAERHLEEALVHLLDNAAVHAETDDPTIAVTVDATERDVRIAISDDGPGLPEDQRRLLETGEITEFDDPTTGFGLNVVQLLVTQYGGHIETDVDETGSTVIIELGRANDHPPPLGGRTRSVADARTAIPHLVVTLGAALIAGVAYGAVAELFGGSIAFIGVYYGVENVVVGWVTHEFHSVVFAFVFAGLVGLAPVRYRHDLSAHVAIGAGWGIALWVGASGIISPIWLGLLGLPVTLPNLSGMLLATHLAWGITLGALTAWGDEHVTPKLALAWNN